MRPASVEDGWLEVGGATLAVTWYRPVDRRAPSPAAPPWVAVLVVGMGMDDRVEALGVPAVAEALSAHGMPTLVVHPTGTGQSDGTLEEPTTIDRWPGDVHGAIAHAVDATAPGASVALIAVRSAALPALLAPLPPAVRAVALWQPVLDGRRYSRELSLLSTAGSEPDDAPHLGAFALSAAFLRRLAGCSVRDAEHRLAAPVLLLADDAPADERSIAHLRDHADALTTVSAPDTARWLSVSSELARTPLDAVDQLVGWVASTVATATATASATATATASATATTPPRDLVALERSRVLHVRGARLRETFVRIGPAHMSAVLAEPADASEPAAGRPAVVLLSSTGPGRSFVDLARCLAEQGHASLRIDLSSFGSSGRHRRQGRGELYAHGAPGDVRAAVRWLHDLGHGDVVLVGFCATAWLAVQVAGEGDVAGAVAINAPLYAPGAPWRTIDGVHGPLGWRLIDRVNRQERIDRLREQVRRRLLPAPGVRRLTRVGRAGTRVLLAFDELDLGLEHLRSRLGAGDVPGVTVQTYVGLGHTLDGVATRRELIADIVTWITRG